MKTYNDINMNLLRHPYTGDIVRRYDLDAIKAAIKNIMLTRKGEKVFEPDFGSDIHGMLFELRTPASKLLFKKKIREAITKWEPRVVITDVQFVDTDSDLTSIEITISFYVMSDSSISGDVTINLERVR